jgi:hypothetical protein
MRLKVVLTNGRRPTEVGFSGVVVTLFGWLKSLSDLPVTVAVALESVPEELQLIMVAFMITQGSGPMYHYYITCYPFVHGSLIALMMEAVHTSETSVNINLTTWHYIPEDSKLHTHRCEKLKSHLCFLVSLSAIKAFNMQSIYFGLDF